MGLNEGITAVLDLVERVHGLRRTLRELLAAICTPAEVIAASREAGSVRQNGEGADHALLPACMGRSG